VYPRVAEVSLFGGLGCGKVRVEFRGGGGVCRHFM
jgi:hypothetical protein